MNTRTHQTLLQTCTAVALPLVLMIGCSESEPVALERGEFNASAVSGIELEPNADSIIVMDTNGLRYLKVSAGTPPETNPSPTPVDTLVTPVVYFSTDNDRIAIEDVDTIQQHAGFLLTHAHSVLNINGHADERGTSSHNADLSARRAQHVALLLTSLGVPAAQLNVASFGASRPVGDPHRWDENRRVELVYADDSLVSAR